MYFWKGNRIIQFVRAHETNEVLLQFPGGLNYELVATVVKDKMLMDYREGGENVSLLLQ